MALDYRFYSIIFNATWNQNRDNPPISHRKEALLPPSHPDVAKFAELTAAEEAAGLYADTRTIGFKQNWEALLAEKGLTYRGHRLVRKAAARDLHDGKEIKRHRTAITRTQLSRPVQSVIETGLLTTSKAFFNYGCGCRLGDDLHNLETLGYTNIAGWDPAYCPDAPRGKADVVNLGFVLNVIEDPAERVRALKDAFEFFDNSEVNVQAASWNNLSQRP